ncbi:MULTISPECIES: hypothetical protein [unclassified Rhizobacter]|uniref:hypothetical protein n=1 Tax=unclassified Rhizobacter TaxID=2640088 RepID=UPI0006F515E0|nr:MULTISPECIES: hypothetical protein [unclassified Rhizobacter]KQU75991.1 hypothetical protein ASC88_24125 [Rhizobacter sp. Root29]KQW08754.1 hypothetical protein ASC98_24855 [Rhizobacter sp. Root1238]KRB16324.1 hypothetical protein ASE08_25735 [Rhizobacter sp. Root16D2]
MGKPALVAAACAIGVALMVALSFGRDAPAGVPAPLPAPVVTAAVEAPIAPPAVSFSASAVQARRAQLELWQQRLARSEDTLTKYKTSTRYPHEARPLAEHPDQLRPFDPVAEEMPLRTPGGQPAKGVHVRSTQDRVFASGAESVRVTVRAVDDDDRPLPLLVTRAVAFDLPDARRPAGRPQVPVNFTEAADGSLAAVLQPSTQGFSDFAGTIRIQAYLNQAGQLGNVNFDVVYNPLVPAEWAGVREALQAGSLDFFLKARVAQPGRYVVSARVDDATGKPFALLSFNDEVAVGEQEFRLRLFGKLVRDGRPAFPLTLRDVQGFLLLPDRFPDRAMLPRQAGAVHTSQAYALDSFSDAEWSSEERSRYLAELSKDVDEAKRQVDALNR